MTNPRKVQLHTVYAMQTTSVHIQADLLGMFFCIALYIGVVINAGKVHPVR